MTSILAQLQGSPEPLHQPHLKATLVAATRDSYPYQMFSEEFVERGGCEEGEPIEMTLTKEEQLTLFTVGWGSTSLHGCNLLSMEAPMTSWQNLSTG
ncbi:hypothetical protein AVEN_216674-1 [Araneus ventricosus]|uniref:Uncharacterized protein n=1 Tax=Araneus ventricosus TaxID=182803 RepID=A0A4Y2DW13_ARAVE|nr:hypothetical protein AVEN_216674-1 [Araneus ventricosus]